MPHHRHEGDDEERRTPSTRKTLQDVVDEMWAQLE